jgi:hypothetical protein
VLGVLRGDGMVSPFAAFDGKRWTAPWPEDIRFVELPISLEAISSKWWGKAGLPAEMAIWSNGAPRGTLRLTRPAVLRVMCARQLALVSTYVPPAPPPPWMVQPYPKEGLVISAGQPIEPIEIVPPGTPVFRSTAVALVEPFDEAEMSALKSLTDWKHPMTHVERRKVPVVLETLYRARMDVAGWTAYHVEAVKRYRPGPEDKDCGLVTYVSGWIMMGPDDRFRMQLGARVTYCDRRENTFMLPLGLIEQGARRYWVYQVSGYEREGYAITRPMPKLNEPHIQYTAGACAG